MLARSAQGLYWMGRYLERAEHLAHHTRFQVASLVDRPLEEIQAGWRRIYESIGRKHPDPEQIGHESGESMMLADSFTLADDLTFERSNPHSIYSCFAMGRENARQMRHCISTEMWLSLNLPYLRVREIRIEDIWQNEPEGFYVKLARDLNAFSGVTEATMYRDEGWNFLRLGYAIERLQLISALVLTQMAMDAGLPQPFEPGWKAILRVNQAFDAHNRAYGNQAEAGNVVNLLVTDPQLPRSVRRVLDVTLQLVHAIGPGPEPAVSARLHRLAGRTHSLIAHEWPDRADRETMLRQVALDSEKLHDLLNEAYFEYPIEDSPER